MPPERRPDCGMKRVVWMATAIQSPTWISSWHAHHPWTNWLPNRRDHTWAGSLHRWNQTILLPHDKKYSMHNAAITLEWRGLHGVAATNNSAPWSTSAPWRESKHLMHRCTQASLPDTISCFEQDSSAQDSKATQEAFMLPGTTVTIVPRPEHNSTIITLDHQRSGADVFRAHELCRRKILIGYRHFPNVCVERHLIRGHMNVQNECR